MIELMNWRAVAVAAGALMITAGVPLRAAEDAAIIARSQVATGDPSRIQKVLAKAQRGEPITVSVIGGSITQGAAASDAAHRYGDLVAAWWQQKFPKTEVKFVNAGIGATASNYGSLRVGRDLLAQQPDFVVVEFSVNDVNTQTSAETLEGLLRQILKSPKQPGVLLLFMMGHDGSSAQEWHSKVGAHYHLPMVSYHDAYWPEIQANRLQWSDVGADAVHPNDRGHAGAAAFITTMLESIAALPPSNAPAASLPAPLFTDVYENTSLFEGADLKPFSNRGWVYNEAGKCWMTDQPGSVIEFDVDGRAILTFHRVNRGPMGRASVSVDGSVPTPLEGWFDQTWGGYSQANIIASGLPLGKHRVRFELLPDKNSGSEGHEFRILGLGGAGLSGK